MFCLDLFLIVFLLGGGRFVFLVLCSLSVFSVVAFFGEGGVVCLFCFVACLVCFVFWFACVVALCVYVLCSFVGCIIVVVCSPVVVAEFVLCCVLLLFCC